MVLTDPYSFVSLGTLQVLTIKIQKQVEGYIFSESLSPHIDALQVITQPCDLSQNRSTVLTQVCTSLESSWRRSKESFIGSPTVICGPLAEFAQFRFALLPYN